MDTKLIFGRPVIDLPKFSTVLTPRSPYIAYLVRSKQQLLAGLAAMERLHTRLETEQRMCSKFLISVCVR